MDKRILVALAAAALGCSLTARGQQPPSQMDHLIRAREAMSLGAYTGVVESLAPLYIETWSLPTMDEEALYLDAIARSCIGTEEADLRLLHFIEEHPHSALLPYAQSRLGEWYYTRGDFASAVYWFDRVDLTILPEERAEAIDYYHAYALMQTGSDEEAIAHFLPLTYSKNFHNAAAFYGGYLQIKTGETTEGERLLSGLYNDSRYGTEAYAYVAESRLAQEDYTEALKLAQKGLKRKQDNRSAEQSLLHSAGLAAAMLDQLQLSTDYLLQYMRSAEQPGRIDMLMLGKNLYELGDEARAADFLVRVDDGTPDFMSQMAHYYIGLVELRRGESGAAEKAFDRAMAIDAYAPLTEDACFNGALTAYATHQGRIGVGTKRLEQYLTRYPSGTYRTKALTHLEDAFLNHPDREAVLRELETISPLPPELKRVREKVRLGQANQALAGGDLSSATKQYDRIIDKDADPESVAEAYLWRGEAAYRRGDYRSAISDTESYLKRRPESLPLNPQAYYTLGYAYFNTGDFAGAERNLRDFLAAKPSADASERTSVLNRLGDIAVQQRRLSDAADYFSRAASAGGSEADYSHLHRAIVLGLAKDYEGKIRLLEEMQRRYPSSRLLAEGFYELGQANEMLGRQSEARSAYDRVLTNFPKHELAPSAGVQKALTYMSEQDFDRAADAYGEVIRRYPHTDAAKAAVDNLRGLGIRLNRVEEFDRLIGSTGAGASLSDSELDEMTYLAADRIVSEGKAADALRALDDYVSRFPKGQYLDKALYSKALLLCEGKEHREAIAPLRRLLEATTDPALLRDAETLLMECYERTGDHSGAAAMAVRLADRTTSRDDRSRLILTATDHALKADDGDFLFALADDVSRSRWDLTAEARGMVMSAAAERYARQGRQDMARLYARAVMQLPEAGQTTAARVIAAEELFDAGDFGTVRQQMEQLVSGQTDSPYWLARAFILLADSYERLGDKVSARSYLESLRSSYTQEDDGILRMVDERLSRL